MKIAKIRFETIGPFQDTSLIFPVGNTGLNIVYGPNEAGKSSVLKYIKYFLFGIPHQNPDDFTHAHSKFLIESTLVDSMGNQHLFRRKKTRTKSLLDHNGTDASGNLDAMMGGVTEQAFSMMFGINHAQLRSRGRQVLKGEGELGTMLFEAGTGLANLRKVLQSLEERASEIYAPRKGELFTLLNSAKAKLESIQNAKLEVTTWQNTLAKVNQLQEELDSLNKQKTELSARQAEVERMGRALSVLTKFKEAKTLLKNLDSVQTLDEETLTKYENALENYSTANAKFEVHEKTVADFTKKLGSLTTDALVISHQGKIEELNQNLGLLIKNLTDLNNRKQDKDKAEADARKLLEEYFSDTNIDNARDLFIDPKTRIQIQELGFRIETEVALTKAAEANLGTKPSQIQSLEKNLQEITTHPQLEKIQDLVQGIRTQKLTPQDMETAQSDLPIQKSKLEGKIGTLPYGPFTLESLLVTRLPTREKIHEFVELFAKNLSRELELRTDIKGRKNTFASKQDQILKLRTEGTLLSREELAKLREYRELAWDAIESQLEGRRVELSEKVAAIAGKNISAKNAFLKIQQQVDQFADKLFTASDQIGRANQLAQDMAGLQEEMAVLEKEIQEIASIREKLEMEWLVLWKEAGIFKPGNPKDMLVWQNSALELQQSCIDLMPLWENLVARRKKQAEAFKELLEITCASEMEIAWKKGEEIIEEGLRLKQEKANITNYLTSLNEEMKQTRDDLQSRKDQQKASQERWSQFMINLKLPSDASTNNAQEHVAAITKIQQHLKEAEASQDRYSKMQDTNKKILDELYRVLEVLSVTERPAADASEIRGVLDRLSTRLAKARQDETRQKELTSGREKAQEALASVGEEVKKYKATLKPLGNIPMDQLARHFQNIRSKNNVEKEYKEARDAIIQEAFGKDLEAYLEELEKADPLEVAGKLTQLRIKTETCEMQRDEVLRNHSVTREALKALEAQTGAHALIAEREILKSQCLELAREFARMTLAKLVLEKTIKNYREANEDPLLRNSCTYLQTMTNNSFVGFAPEDADGEKALSLIRNNDGPTVPFAADNIGFEEGSTILSDGTSDQLFLALRLAAIEQHLGKLDQPIPVILDDILINFDNERAVAAMDCLAKLSEKTQVIMFTHHRHIGDLIKKCQRKESIFFQEMPHPTTA